MARRRGGGGRIFRHGGRRYQWFGFQNTNVVIDSAAVDNFIVVPTNAGVSEQANVTLVTVHIHITVVVNVIVRAVDQTLVAVLQKSEADNVGAPTGVIDPVSLNAFDLGNGDVLGWWQIPAPEATPPVVATQVAMRTTTLHSKAKRRLKMREHVVSLAMSGFDVIDSQASVLTRALVQY